MNLHEGISNYSIFKYDKIEYFIYDSANTPGLDIILKIFNTFSYSPWIFSLIGSLLVGLSGIFPLLVIPIKEGENLKSGDGANRLRVLLSFAVGGLLGDVFLHLLPEAWQHGLKYGDNAHPSLFSGVWVLIGMLVFVIVEKLCSSLESNDKPSFPLENSHFSKEIGVDNRICNRYKQIQDPKKKISSVCINNNNSNNKNYNNNNNLKHFREEKTAETKEQHYHISGYLNLMANSVDNFTHGLAIGGSFSISFKMGVLSTFAILIHELPHEIGDFAILLKSGFSRWEAAKAQLCTALAGIVGAMFAVTFGSSDPMDSKTSWILPFTAGGFLHIALVTVLPELVHEESKFESCKQLGSLFSGIASMAFVITFFE